MEDNNVNGELAMFDKPQIEKGVPLANRRMYPWLKELEVGDSFLWPSKNLACLRSAAYFEGVNIAARKQDDGLHRVWRRS